MNPLLAMSLILLVDVSSSVDEKEYAIQKDGIVAALTDPSIYRAIWNQGGACLAYIEFSDNPKIVVPWTPITSPGDALHFAALVKAAPRSSFGSTNVFGGITGALSYFPASPCGGERVLDVSGDGAQNLGGTPPPPLSDVRINGLPIANEEPELPEWYQANVVRNGFLLPVTSFEDFPHAIRQKLAREISGN